MTLSRNRSRLLFFVKNIPQKAHLLSVQLDVDFPLALLIAAVTCGIFFLEDESRLLIRDGGRTLSDEIAKSFEVINEFTKVELPDGGSLETDSPVIETAIAIGVVGAVGYSLYKLFNKD